MKAAVIYYSRSGVTGAIAEKIGKAFQADLYFVEPEKAYGGYLSAVLRNGREKLTKKTAKVVTAVSDYADYDVIFTGFPVWYGSMPDFMREYFKKCRISKKKIIPFVTAGAGGKDASLAMVKSLFPDCDVSHYFFSAGSEKGDVDAWLDEVKRSLG